MPRPVARPVLSCLSLRSLGAPLLLAALGLLGCPASDPETTATAGETSESDSDTDTDTGEPDATCEGLEVPALDEGSCMPLATDYIPGGDAWPACISDDGTYHLVADTPGSIARIVDYEAVAALLWADGAEPTPEDFTMARTIYATDEGLESRLVRREDLWYPPVPMEDWDPLVDDDKQCSVAANVEKYPERCAGPGKISPLVVDAFAAGQTSDGDPRIHAARIEAGLLWFIYLSVYKEGNTCATTKARDCDSAWAYYTGGESVDGGLGLAAAVRAASPPSHGRIWDGLLAIRCWRELTRDGDDYPLLSEVSSADQQRFAQAWEQLGQGLHRGYARVIRQRLQTMIDRRCAGDSTAADWAFLEIAGPVLDREAAARGNPEATGLKALWGMSNPSAENLAAGIAALDAIFACG